MNDAMKKSWLVMSFCLLGVACSDSPEEPKEDETIVIIQVDMGKPEEDMASPPQDMDDEPDMMVITPDLGGHGEDDMPPEIDMAPSMDMEPMLVRTVEEVQFWAVEYANNHVADPNFTNIDSEFSPLPWDLYIAGDNSGERGVEIGRKRLASAPGGLATTTAHFAVDQPDKNYQFTGVFFNDASAMDVSYWVGVKLPEGVTSVEFLVDAITMNRFSPNPIVFQSLEREQSATYSKDGITWFKFSTTLAEGTFGVSLLGVLAFEPGVYYFNSPIAMPSSASPNALVQLDQRRERPQEDEKLRVLREEWRERQRQRLLTPSDAFGPPVAPLGIW